AVAVVAEGDTVRVLDVSDPTAPVEVGSTCVSGGAALDLALAWPVLLVANGRAVDVIDVSDPAHPTTSFTWEGTPAATSVALDRGTAAVAGGPRVELVDVTALDGTSVHVATQDAQHWLLGCLACNAPCATRASIVPSALDVCVGTRVRFDATTSTLSGCVGATFDWLVNGAPFTGAAFDLDTP